MNLGRFLILWILIFAWAAGKTSAQTLRFDISIQMDRLSVSDQELLRPLEQKLEDYVNNYDWTGEYREILIECSANLIIETVTSRGSEKIYRAQFLVSSPSGENYYDKSCEFAYQQGQSMNRNRAIFDPLLSLVDYYINMVLGGEMDTWLLRGGSEYYDKALDIANEGVISNYSLGWQSRLDAVKLITDSDHIPLREAKRHYYDCLYFIEAKKDPDNARRLSNLVLEKLESVHQRRPNSAALKRFFDAHYTEICSLFLFAENRDYAQRLINMDPRHSETYRSCSEGVQF